MNDTVKLFVKALSCTYMDEVPHMMMQNLGRTKGVSEGFRKPLLLAWPMPESTRSRYSNRAVTYSNRAVIIYLFLKQQLTTQKILNSLNIILEFLRLKIFLETIRPDPHISMKKFTLHTSTT